MDLSDIVNRAMPPPPWTEGENLPWDDPSFSERMLGEHLSQEHDLASRRFHVVDRQVEWIHREVLRGVPTRILDLACGPGLYTNRLGMLGHECCGIDYAPASIRRAEEEAVRERLACTYRRADVRKAEYGEGYGLVMVIYGQFNVFRRADASSILEKAFSALSPDGLLLLEPQRFETVAEAGATGNTWYSCGNNGGLFSGTPHLCLEESFWHAEEQASTRRFFVVDTATGDVARHAFTNEAYTDAQYQTLLIQTGFNDVRFFPSLIGAEVEEESQAANLVVIGRKMPNHALENSGRSPAESSA